MVTVIDCVVAPVDQILPVVDDEVNITEPLYKKIQMGCARTFTQGVLNVINVSNQEKIKLDYDPYNNNACDLIAKATIRSKEFIFTVR